MLSLDSSLEEVSEEDSKELVSWEKDSTLEDDSLLLSSLVVSEGLEEEVASLEE